MGGVGSQTKYSPRKQRVLRGHIKKTAEELEVSSEFPLLQQMRKHAAGVDSLQDRGWGNQRYAQCERPHPNNNLDYLLRNKLL